MQLVDHDIFLKRLAALFESKKEHGSIWITTKRLKHDGEDTAMKHEDDGLPDTREYPCLLRVTDGKTNKFSTKVNPDELPGFYSQYGSLLKSSMSTLLRKRDKKREKTRAEEATKRRVKMTEPIVLLPDGQKRGKGRRQRQRKIKALMKQQASQGKFKEREEARKAVE